MSAPKYTLNKKQRLGKLIFETVLYVVENLKEKELPSVLRTCRWNNEGNKIEVILGSWSDFASFISNNMKSRGYSENDFEKSGEFSNYSSQFLKGLIYLKEMGLIVFHNEKDAKAGRGQVEKKFDIIKLPAAPQNLDGYLAFFDRLHENHQKLQKIEKTSSKVLREPIKFGIPYPRNPYFTGRKKILEQLHEQLLQQTSVAITQVEAISGLGGIGKTQTAVEYAFLHFHDEKTYEYVFWVNAETETNISVDFAALADQLALPSGKGKLDEKILVMKAWLANHTAWLLIFDNADTPSLLEPWIPNNPEGKILITSRASVFLEIGISSSFALEPMSTTEGTEMLFRRTGYEETESERAAAAELNEELGGLPLALEQASAYMRKQRMSIQEYLIFYRKRGFSGALKKKAKPKHYPESVFRTWQLNFNAVKKESIESTYLLHFSSFLAPDDIPYRIFTHASSCLGETLATVFDNDEDEEDRLFTLKELLEPLSQYSLIGWNYQRPYYSIHRLVQAVIRDQMNQSTTERWTAQAIEVLIAAYPGEEFKYWDICSDLLPHWLMVSEQTTAESESLALLNHYAGWYLNEQGDYNKAENLYQKALSMRKNLLGSEHIATATTTTNLSTLYFDRSLYQEAEKLCIEALSIRRKLLGDENIHVAGSIHNLAECYRLQGRYEEAEPLFEESLDLRKQLLGDEHPDAALSLNNLAGIYIVQKRYSDAEQLLQEALMIRSQCLGEGHPDTLSTLNNLAECYRHQGRYSEAEPLFEKALKSYRQLWGNEHSNVALCLNNIANCIDEQGRHKDAEALFEEAISISIKFLGEESVATANYYNNLAGCYRNQNLYNEAESLYEKALILHKKALSNYHPSVAVNINNLAEIYCLQGRYSDAEKSFKSVLEIHRRLRQGKAHPDIVSSLQNLAACFYLQSRYSEAEALFLEALSCCKQFFGDEHFEVVSIIETLASLYVQQTRYSEAESLFKKSLKLYQKISATNHPKIVGVLDSLTSLYERQGIYADAIPYYQKKLDLLSQIFKEEHPDIIDNLNKLATCYFNQGCYKEAENLHKQLLRICVVIFGEHHPFVLSTIGNLGVIYSYQECFEEAEILYKRLIKTYKSMPEEKHAEIMSVVANLANIYYDMGRDQEADALLKGDLTSLQTTTTSSSRYADGLFDALDQSRYKKIIGL